MACQPLYPSRFLFRGPRGYLQFPGVTFVAVVKTATALSARPPALHLTWMPVHSELDFHLTLTKHSLRDSLLVKINVHPLTFTCSSVLYNWPSCSVIQLSLPSTFPFLIALSSASALATALAPHFAFCSQFRLLLPHPSSVSPSPGDFWLILLSSSSASSGPLPAGATHP